VIALVAALATSAGAMSSIELPGGQGGIGFDDLGFTGELRRFMVPAGRTGRLDLVDPADGAVTSIEGFSRSSSPARGHEQGTTSADAGEGYIFAVDRTERTLVAVDATAKRIVARTRLGGGPDYVRWVGSTREAWVTEPDRQAIEVFSLEPGAPPSLEPKGSISVPGGPESLIIDPAGARAYTNDFRGATFAIDVPSHSVTARWANTCKGARGIALDARRGIAFVGCDEGKAVALDVVRGALLGEARTGRGVDGIAYDPQLAHLYVPAARSGNLTVVGVSGRGELEELGSVPAADGAHCVATDDRGDVYVCDPGKGRLLAFRDPYPASRR
jgi:DNA-binding beta-propeller fold protein YncE